MGEEGDGVAGEVQEGRGDVLDTDGKGSLSAGSLLAGDPAEGVDLTMYA